MSTLNAGQGTYGLTVPWPDIRPRNQGGITTQFRLLASSALNPSRRDWTESTSSTALERERSIEQLAERYAFTDFIAVAGFLRENPFLLDILLELHERIRDYFGSDVGLMLEVFTDPEADDFQQLFALIHTGLPLEREATLLESLYDEWWLDTLPATRGKLVVSAE